MADLLLEHCPEAADWPLLWRRGQVTEVPPELAQGLPRPRLPLASGGYLIALPPALGGGLLCGATSQADDADPQVRVDDHRSNLRQIGALTGQAVDAPALSAQQALGGRVGWRLFTADRMPLVGPVPVPADLRAQRLRQEQPRQVPRIDGLYVLSALGSRGLTWAPLLGEALAAWISGAASPLSSSLLDAIDPATLRQVGVSLDKALAEDPDRPARMLADTERALHNLAEASDGLPDLLGEAKDTLG